MKNKKNILKVITLSLVLSLSLYAAEEPKDASSFTKQKNEQVLKELPFSDTQDFTAIRLKNIRLCHLISPASLLLFQSL